MRERNLKVLEVMKSQVLTTESASQLPEPVVLTPDQIKVVAGAIDDGLGRLTIPPRYATVLGGIIDQEYTTRKDLGIPTQSF